MQELFRRFSRRSFDDNVLPERNPAPNVGGRRLRLRIVPGCSFVNRAVDRDVVVTRFALPRTMRVFVTHPEVFATNRVRREVMVSLHDDGVVALRDSLALPGCLHGLPFLRLPELFSGDLSHSV